MRHEVFSWKKPPEVFSWKKWVALKRAGGCDGWQSYGVVFSDVTLEIQQRQFHRLAVTFTPHVLVQVGWQHVAG